MFTFVFVVNILRGGSEKMLLLFMLESVWPMFSSKSLIVSGLISRSAIIFVFVKKHFPFGKKNTTGISPLNQISVSINKIIIYHGLFHLIHVKEISNVVNTID